MSNQVAAGARDEIRRAVELECELIGERSDKLWCHRVTDMSSGGLWLNTASPSRAGEQVVVCFRPNDEWQGAELMVFAEVVRVMSVRARGEALPPNVGMALEFMDLTVSEHAMLSDWLDRQRKPIPRRRRPVPSSQTLPSCWR